jgi:nucleotide-binding universal stress UspA family protein
MYKRVLVTLDGSPLAEAILPFITEIAGPLDMEVVLLRVVHPIPPQVVEGSRHVVLEDVEARLAEAREYLRPLAAQLAARGVRVRTEVRHGDTITEIIGCAKTMGADLIAMTTHGRGGLGRVLFGSIAEAVLRQAEIPVFLMRLTKSQMRSRGTQEVLR